MDLKTSFALYFVSLALYVIVLTAMALADKRVIGTRWLAYSVLAESIKMALQVMTGAIPRVLTTMVANELNVVAFFAMYMGLRWFMQREPLRSRIWPTVMLVMMVVYSGMFLLHIPYAYQVIATVSLVLCGATVWMLWQQKEERFQLPAQITVGLLVAHMGLALYRVVLAIDVYRRGPDWRTPIEDPRWAYSMLAIVMLANCLLIMYVWFAAAEMYSAVEATAGIDALTGCLNRRALMRLAAQELARSERTGMPLTVVAIDLDHFKSVNDTFGHAGGDATLCAVVALLQDLLRPVDVVARTGGEEFLLLLPDTDAVSGAKVVEGLRQAIDAMELEYEGRVIRTTMSAGVTQGIPRSDSWTAIMNRADRALYGAKHGGRNCVVVDEQVLKLPRRVIGAADETSRDETRPAGSVSALRLIRKRQG
jgi:diguanylate cyclase (GGDEF)-like protein